MSRFTMLQSRTQGASRARVRPLRITNKVSVQKQSDSLDSLLGATTPKGSPQRDLTQQYGYSVSAPRLLSMPTPQARQQSRQILLTLQQQQQPQQQHPKESPQIQEQPQHQQQQQPQQQSQEQPSSEQESTEEPESTEETVPIPEPVNGVHDIMLSYNWDHQETAFKVRDYFRSEGNLSVWIDVEQMSGDMNTKMAQAIVKSKMIIMCLSEKYQNSANCKKEYEYTDKKSKKFIPLKVEDSFQPEDGTSLDLILGQQLYYCIEKEEDFDKNMPKVLNIILDFLKRKK